MAFSVQLFLSEQNLVQEDFLFQPVLLRVLKTLLSEEVLSLQKQYFCCSVPLGSYFLWALPHYPVFETPFSVTFRVLPRLPCCPFFTFLGVRFYFLSENLHIYAFFLSLFLKNLIFEQLPQLSLSTCMMYPPYLWGYVPRSLVDAWNNG